MDLHVVEQGAGQPILFIHAGVADSRMWRDQMDLDGYRSIAFDKRGYGKTPWVAESYSDTDDSLAVLDQCGVESAVVVGCSMGGATALDLAINHSERVDKLVLVGAYPSGWVPPDGWEENPLEEEGMEAAKAGDIERVVEIDYQMWVVGYGREASAIDPAHKQLFFDMDRTPAATEVERNEYQTGFEIRLNEHLDEIETPTLVMVGAHDEKLLIDAAHYMAAKLGDTDAVIIEDAAHLPSMEQPEAFNRALLSFLS